MTVRTFKEISSGIKTLQLRFHDKWIVGKEIDDYNYYLITRFHFTSDDGTLCILDIEEID